MTFPNGGLRPREGVQRGSVQDSTEFMGDPLTPNIGATPDAKRLAIKNAPPSRKFPCCRFLTRMLPRSCRPSPDQLCRKPGAAACRSPTGSARDPRKFT